MTFYVDTSSEKTIEQTTYKEFSLTTSLMSDQVDTIEYGVDYETYGSLTMTVGSEYTAGASAEVDAGIFSATGNSELSVSGEVSA